MQATIKINELYPAYVTSDYDRFVFDSVIDQELVSEWRSLVRARQALKARHQYDKTIRMWKLITPAWYAIKAAFQKAGGVVVSAAA